MAYEVYRTKSADMFVRKVGIVLSYDFGNRVGVRRMRGYEKEIMSLSGDPFRGTVPKDELLKSEGYRVLILKYDLIFYKIDEAKQRVTVHLVIDKTPEYMEMIEGIDE